MFPESGSMFLACSLKVAVRFAALIAILLAGLTSGILGGIISTLLIVILGEIIPQAACSRHGLVIGTYLFFFLALVDLTFSFSRAPPPTAAVEALHIPIHKRVGGVFRLY
jgi:metal transporter CNNM